PRGTGESRGRTTPSPRGEDNGVPRLARLRKDWAVSAVLIIGMHRGGTSAVTRAVNLLGVPIAREAEGFRAASSNPTGFWEARSLTRLNEEILGAFGGTWSAPPPLPAGWQTDARLHDLRAEAPRTFE